jgi:hypothetical protein
MRSPTARRRRWHASAIAAIVLTSPAETTSALPVVPVIVEGIS